MTIPLLTTSNGEKFGKSAGNAVWLDEGRTGISDFYQVSQAALDVCIIYADTQFFIRSTDEDVGKYLRLFTLLPLERIDEIMAEHQVRPFSRHSSFILHPYASQSPLVDVSIHKYCNRLRIL
jgi:tyrosyl-tRNA synthetase